MVVDVAVVYVRITDIVVVVVVAVVVAGGGAIAFDIDVVAVVAVLRVGTAPVFVAETLELSEARTSSSFVVDVIICIAPVGVADVDVLPMAGAF